VWPPNLFDRENAEIARDRVPARSNKKRIMELTDFVDDDLGPAGRFVTRWGSDPIRSHENRPDSSNLGSFIPKAHFLDYSDPQAEGFDVEIVSQALMPVDDSRAAKAADQKTEALEMMSVSLLTYQPRFDIATSEWYVDVRMECPHEAEPFVRFGLVRYQEHAPEDKRVSFPVVQWAQLLPRRTVEVVPSITRTSVGATVRVSGLASEVFSADGLGPPEAKPHMLARLVREHAPHGESLRRRVVSEQDIYSDAANLKRGEGLRYIWEAGLEAERDSTRDDRDQAKYYVFVEESEDRRPATFANEPVGLDDGALSTYVRSGPRFQARIEVPIQRGRK
jgi:hypothetical protein